MANYEWERVTHLERWKCGNAPVKSSQCELNHLLVTSVL